MRDNRTTCHHRKVPPDDTSTQARNKGFGALEVEKNWNILTINENIMELRSVSSIWPSLCPNVPSIPCYNPRQRALLFFFLWHQSSVNSSLTVQCKAAVLVPFSNVVGYEWEMDASCLHTWTIEISLNDWLQEMVFAQTFSECERLYSYIRALVQREMWRWNNGPGYLDNAGAVKR